MDEYHDHPEDQSYHPRLEVIAILLVESRLFRPVKCKYFFPCCTLNSTSVYGNLTTSSQRSQEHCQAASATATAPATLASEWGSTKGRRHIWSSSETWVTMSRMGVRLIKCFSGLKWQILHHYQQIIILKSVLKEICTEYRKFILNQFSENVGFPRSLQKPVSNRFQFFFLPCCSCVTSSGVSQVFIARMSGKFN